ncbi:MAG: PAS domain-containing protein [Nitrospirales bacterium]
MSDPNNPSFDEAQLMGILRSLMHNLPGMAYRCRWDPDWTMSFVSEGANALCGYDPSELIGKGAVSWGREIIHAEDRQWNRNTGIDCFY